LNGTLLPVDRFFRLDDASALSLITDSGFELDRETLVSLDSQRLSANERTTRIRAGELTFDTTLRGASVTVTPVHGRMLSAGKRIRAGHVLALDEAIADHRGLDIAMGRIGGDPPPKTTGATDTLDDSARCTVGRLEVREIRHEFAQGQKIALDSLHFTVDSGQMMAVMGPSGSGKTTLLKCLLGEITPTRFLAEIDGESFQLSKSRRAIGYVPQDDLLFENLTVRENLYYCARIRMPHWTDRSRIEARIDYVLSLMGLSAKADLRVGNVMRKTLSGGERKRLNIALELLADPAVIILDEPTSGLSSKDSENLIEVLDELKHRGKIVIATIHQPNADLFQRFDRLLLLDTGGVQVFFGSTIEVFDYFDEELSRIIEDHEILSRKKELRLPDYFFDILEYREGRANNGLRERKYPPAHWRDKYRRTRLFAMLQDDTGTTGDDSSTGKANADDSHLSLTVRLRRWGFLLTRNIRNKLTNRLNLAITFVASPVLGLIIAGILRSTPEGGLYLFRNNNNIGMFLFISIVIFLFLGMANSIHEIIAERRVIARERKLGLYSVNYLGVKTITLALITVVQVILYLLPSLPVLSIRGMFTGYFIYFLLSGGVGNAIGLTISAWLHDRETATNLMPYLLIPQILFAGVVIQFTDMNPALRIHRSAAVPEFCELIPSRWLFEGLTVTQVKHNAWARIADRDYARMCKASDMTERDRILICLNEWQECHPRAEYRNALLEDWVAREDGKYTKTGYNQFMASKRYAFGREWDVSVFDAIIALLMISALTTLSGILLERSTR
jgi:ABC-type multidrug transport system ATPase subunit